MRKIVTLAIILLSIRAVSFSQHNNNHNGWNNTPLKDFTFYHQYFTKYSKWSHNPWEYNKYPWNHHNKEWTNIFLPWGNVGIGTIMPEAKLHVIGYSIFEGRLTADTLDIETNLQIGNDLAVFGKLGIGVNSPTEKLEVDGNIKSTGFIRADSLSTRTLFSEYGLFSNKLSVSNNLFVSGSIGLGVENPTEKLEVDGNIKASSIFIENELSANSLDVTTLSSKDIFVTGNVGIGTDQPEAPLHVKGSIRTQSILCDDEIITVNLFGTHAAFNTLNLNSKLGIGVNDPSEALEVTGNGLFSGNIKSNSFETGEIISSGNLKSSSIETGNIVSSGNLKSNSVETGDIISSGNLSLQNSLYVNGDANITGNISAEKLTVNTIDIPTGLLAMNEVSAQNINVGAGLTIGTEELPDEYMLAVKGNIIAEKIKVRLFADWPDYVFADNYKLKNINSLEKFIETNNHLPGIPSAKEMEKEDIDLGEMQVKLLEKVEELTLYIIELNKENEALKERITQIEKAAE